MAASAEIQPTTPPDLDQPKQSAVTLEALNIPEITRGKEIDLTGQVAIVTGGTSGIGRAIALKYAWHGADVVVNSRGSKPDEAREVVELIQRMGRKGLYIPGDVSYPGDPNSEDPEKKQSTAEKIVKQTIAEFGKVDILVNNAGTTRDDLIMRMKDEDWNTVMDTTTKGTFLMSRAVLRQMMRQRSGRIINMSSIVSQVGNAGQANYSAAKGAVDAFTRSFAAEVGSRNITVNSIAPGWVETPLTRKYTAEQKQVFDSRRAIPTEITPEDIAETALFLASDRARLISGSIINVDAGTVRR